MKKSVKLLVFGLIVSAIFLIIAVDHIPHIIAWLPMLVTICICSNSRDFRLWAYKMSVKYVRFED